MKRLLAPLSATAAGALALMRTNPAFACAVCFGDPNSSLTKGAKAGVLVLLGVIVTLLSAIGYVIVFWSRRARAMQG